MRCAVVVLTLMLCGSGAAQTLREGGVVPPPSDPGSSWLGQRVGWRPGATVSNTVGMRLVWIPPGTFQMGGPRGDGGPGPVHSVRISRGFWMGATEVTQGEWTSVVGSDPSRFKGSRRPVEAVSWDDCQDFCRKLTELEQSRGALPQGMVYRLPTEAEWEYACRAGTTGARYGELGSIGLYEENSGRHTGDVGNKRANAWGLYDMLGNVSEWCQDGRRSYSAEPQTDPVGPNGGWRVQRGGYWNSDAKDCRAANRLETAPDLRLSYDGCRVVVGVPVATLAAPSPTPAQRPAASSRSSLETMTNASGMKLVWIPPGTFQMGRPGNEPDHFSHEGPAHEVRLARGFWMGATEVTQRDWEAVMGANPSNFKGSRRPVEMVNWNDCQDFCRKLTEREQSLGTLPRGSVYRLPTEAEWEYACRAGTTGERYGELGSVAWYQKNSGNETHDVGQLLENPWGLYDMLGNVWEWCQDGCRRYSVDSRTDPVGPFVRIRAQRGGAWYYSASTCSATFRFGAEPDRRHNFYGCRVVLGAPVRPE